MIKTIDGKKYIELEKREIILFFIVLVLTIILSITLFVLYTNLELIKTDPFVYATNKHKINACSCITLEGRLLNFLDGKLTISDKNLSGLKITN